MQWRWGQGWNLWPCPELDADASGHFDGKDLAAVIDRIFAGCVPHPESVFAASVSTLRVVERAATGLLAAFQFVNGTSANLTPPDTEPGSCPVGGMQSRGCEVLDDGLVRLPFRAQGCVYLSDDAFVTADGGFSLTGIGSCPGLFLPSGSRLDVAFDLAVGIPPLLPDAYSTELRGIIEEIGLGSETCALSDIEASFAGDIAGESSGRAFRLQSDDMVAQARFGGAFCVPQELTLTLDGAGRVMDAASFDSDSRFDSLAVTVDVTPNLEARVDVSGAFETAETDRVELRWSRPSNGKEVARAAVSWRSKLSTWLRDYRFARTVWPTWTATAMATATSSSRTVHTQRSP